MTHYIGKKLFNTPHPPPSGSTTPEDPHPALRATFSRKGRRELEVTFKGKVKLISFILFVLLTGCSLTGGNAIVEEATHHHKSRYYLVHKGDTLYSIAFSFSQNYKDLAQWNRLNSSYEIHPGQLLVITSHQHRPPPIKV